MRTPTILIADDDQELTNSLALRCQNLGLNAEVAFDAMEAIRQIDQVLPQLVILDVNMPSGTGLGVCEMMARHEKLSSTPVIMLTGDCDREIIRRCHNLCAYYVQKSPDSWRRIEPLLHELLDLSGDDSQQASPVDQLFSRYGWYEEIDDKDLKLI